MILSYIINGFNWQHEAGVGGGGEMTFTATGYNVDNAFFRLVYTDDPFSSDFDNDNISNLDELGLGLNPFDNSSSDGDALPDDWEMFYFTSLTQGNLDDFDQDSRSEIDEYNNGTDPTDNDHDDDLLLDVWELTHFQTINKNGGGDFDSDGLTDRVEFVNGSNPTIKDAPLPPVIVTTPGSYFGSTVLQLTNPNSFGQIIYTIDGSEPNIQSSILSGNEDVNPLTFDNAIFTLKAKIFHSGAGLSSTVSAAFNIKYSATQSRNVYFGYNTNATGTIASIYTYDEKINTFVDGKYLSMGKGWIDNDEVGFHSDLTVLGNSSSIYHVTTSVQIATTQYPLIGFTKNDTIALFAANEFYSIGKGWIHDKNIYKPDLNISESEIGNVYFGSKIFPLQAQGFQIYTNDSATFDPGKFVFLGKGWVNISGNSQVPNSFIPHLNRPAETIYYGHINLTGSNSIMLYSHDENCFLPQNRIQVGNGWIEDFNKMKIDPAESIVNDIQFGRKNSFPQSIFVFADMSLNTLDGNTIALGAGKLRSAVEFSPDIVNQNLGNVWLGSANVGNQITFPHTYNQSDLSSTLTNNGNGWIYNDNSNSASTKFMSQTIADSDDDNDNLSRAEEIFIYQTNPDNADSDGDLLNDKFEIDTNQLDPLTYNDPNDDFDGDGLSNIEEFILGSNPGVLDSDNDGFNDNEESQAGTNPNDLNDNINSPNYNADNVVELKLTIGDHSGSHSERYEMVITRDSDGVKVANAVSATFGSVAEITSRQFRLGESYTIVVNHIQSKEINPDYDYTAKVEYVDGPNEDIFILYDEQMDVSGQPIAGLLGIHDEGTENYANGKSAKIFLLNGLSVDKDRNGFLTFNDEDNTTSTNPYTFWINNDTDTDSEVGDDPDSNNANHSDNVINSIRDLEDFTRLHLDISGMLDLLKNDEIEIVLKYINTSGSPSIKLWKALDNNGGTGYLENTSIAQQHISLGQPGIISNSQSYVIIQQFWDDLPLGTQKAYFLFEGVNVGKGEIIFEVQKNGQEIGKAPSVWLELKNIKQMYQRARATPSSGFDPPYDFSVTPSIPTVSWENASDGFSFEQPINEENQIIIFVHGWNITNNEWLSFSETMFKRLWWQGYKGRFCSFNWPTHTLSDIFVLDSYNTSEHRAWIYGESLKQYVTSLPSSYDKNIAAHSMGNIVVGSALKKGMIINNYALMQAAVPAGSYDVSASLDYAPLIDAENNAGPLEKSPDLANPDLGYRGHLSNISGRLVNFHNRDDFALATGSLAFGVIQANWEANQADFKPHDPIGSGEYRYNGTSGWITFVVDPNRNVTDHEEMMSFIARSRTRAVGAQENVLGSIDAEIDLNLAPYNFDNDRYHHSGQFNLNIQELDAFYQRLLEELE